MAVDNVEYLSVFNQNGLGIYAFVLLLKAYTLHKKC